MKSCATLLRFLTLVIALVFAAPAAHAAASGAGEVLEKDIPLKVTEVAPGLYFQYHHQESNNAFLVTNEGVLVIDARTHRTQGQNREDARERLTDLIRKALVRPKRRKKTRPGRAAKERRLDTKQRRADTTRGRGPLRDV